MKRKTITPRNGYQEIVENLGFDFHSDYWKEDSYYELESWEVDRIYEATNKCYKMYCDMVQYVIDKNLFSRFNIPEWIVPFIIKSWNDDDLSLYGRFDFAMNEYDNLKLLEFNADTPTSLYESSVIQWNWKDQVFPDKDQFNSIHESLVKSWKDIHESYKYKRYDFGCISEIEEELVTTSYLASTAQEAGLDTSLIDMRDIVRNNDSFYLSNGDVINCMFKLYPWEVMLEEEFGRLIPETEMIWIEPIWKMIMSSKMSLVILYEMYGSESGLIPPAFESPDLLDGSYAKKPISGREGSNVTLMRNGGLLEFTDGDYSDDKFIYQSLIDIKDFDGRYPVIGSWVIGGESCGIGIRETSTRVTDNMSNFIPHIIL